MATFAIFEKIVKFWSLFELYLCPPPPLKKGAYGFATVGWSVDHVLSAKYLLIPSRDQYQTWCRGCPQWVYDPYWFSGQMFKGQGQTTLLSPLYCPLNIWTFHLINIKLSAGDALNEYMIPIDFQVTCSKVKVQPLFSAHCVVRSISFDPFTGSIPIWCRGCPLWVNGPYWFSGHMFKGPGQTTLLSPVCCPLYIF